jgi:hypothetical protein
MRVRNNGPNVTQAGMIAQSSLLNISFFFRELAWRNSVCILNDADGDAA